MQRDHDPSPARNDVNICFVQLLGEEISSFSRGKYGNAKWLSFRRRVTRLPTHCCARKAEANHSTKTNSRIVEETRVTSCSAQSHIHVRIIRTHIFYNNLFRFFFFHWNARLSTRAKLLNRSVKFSPNCSRSHFTQRRGTPSPAGQLLEIITTKIITTINRFLYQLKPYL